MNSFPELQSTASTLFSAYASLAATVMLLRSMANDVIPPQLISYITTFLSKFFSKPLTANVTIIVDEQTGMTRNQIYDSAEIYLGTKLSPDADRFKVNKNPRQKNINVNIEKNEEVKDSFENIQLTWRFVTVEPEGNGSHYSQEKRFFELIFEKKYKDKIVSDYLPFVIAKAKEIKENDRDVKLYTRDCPYNDDDDNGNGVWGSIKLEHPSTFETLAMEPEMKKSIIDDLDRFVRRRDYYKKVGKAWKRGYLLYGPPGTGKSSLIAAMANYLKFDIYDLELTSLYSNSELRRILVSTTNRSIVVIEDIDCSVEMQDREGANSETGNSKLTLSGLLNFIDGLWSSCGDERIIIFTTNHKDKLDPALLRPGRMDMHIHMSYCTFNSFKVLAFNYLGITDYPKLFAEIEGLIENMNVTPAEIAEELMRSEEVDGALQGVVNLLLRKGKTAKADNIDDGEKSVEVNKVDDDENCSHPEANGIQEERDLDGSESLSEAKKLETKKIVNDVLRDYGIRRRRRGRVGKKGL